MKTYNKLVRDKIPDICLANGDVPETSILDEASFRAELKKKLCEEAAEFVADGNLEELADVLELIKANAEANGSSIEEIERMRAQKAKERGGFSKRIFLISTNKSPN